MYATGNKKMLNMLILEILEQYSDEEHHLTQQEILRLLEHNYGMECDRRSVKSNVLSLVEMGYEIDMTSGYYLAERKFEDAELRMLIDSVLFSKTISVRQAKTLISKLESMGNKYFHAKVSHISNLPELQHGDNKQLIYVVDALNDAIDKKRKVSFTYNSYGTDFKLHPRREEPYIVNPYQMVANNGRFYLLGNYDKYDNIAHFRLDKVTNIQILDEKIKPIKALPETSRGLNLPTHMAEHIYMFSGASDIVIFRAKSFLMNELVDWFGDKFTVSDETDDEMTVRVKCNLQAMKFWALQYGPYVDILSPESLREQLISDITKMMENYSD